MALSESAQSIVDWADSMKHEECDYWSYYVPVPASLIEELRKAIGEGNARLPRKHGVERLQRATR